MFTAECVTSTWPTSWSTRNLHVIPGSARHDRQVDSYTKLSTDGVEATAQGLLCLLGTMHDIDDVICSRLSHWPPLSADTLHVAITVLQVSVSFMSIILS